MVRILLIEDNKLDIELTKEAFDQVQPTYKIHIMESGEEALNYLLGKAKYTDRQQLPLPDLILLDLNLPGVNGFEILKRAKETPIVKRIPIVVLTSSMEEGDRALSYDAGANSYLVKPVGFSEFLTIVQQVGEYWFSLNTGPPKDNSMYSESLR